MVAAELQPYELKKKELTVEKSHLAVGDASHNTL